MLDDDGSGTASIAAILQSVGNDIYFYLAFMQDGVHLIFKGKFSKARKQINLPTISDVKEDTAQEGQGAIKYNSFENLSN